MIYLYLFGTCFHFIYVFMIIGKYLPRTWVTTITLWFFHVTLHRRHRRLWCSWWQGMQEQPEGTVLHGEHAHREPET